MKYIDKEGLTHLKNTLREERKTEIEKATNKILPINIYKFSSVNEMQQNQEANDGDLGIVVGVGTVYPANFTSVTRFSTIEIVNSIRISLSTNLENGIYYFGGMSNLDGTILTFEKTDNTIKIIIRNQDDIIETFIYTQRETSAQYYDLTQGEVGIKNLIKECYFDGRLDEEDINEKEFNSNLATFIKPLIDIRSIYLKKDIMWDKIITEGDNNYVTRAMVEIMIRQAIQEALGNNN